MSNKIIRAKLNKTIDVLFSAKHAFNTHFKDNIDLLAYIQEASSLLNTIEDELLKERNSIYSELPSQNDTYYDDFVFEDSMKRFVS